MELQTNLSKSFEVECNNLKELLNKSQTCQRNLTTTCFILFGMLKALIKQNNDLKEQRNIFETVYLNWSKILNETQMTSTTRLVEEKLKGKINDNDNVLAKPVDYSPSSSMISGSTESLTDSLFSAKEKKKFKNINGLFRKVSILIMAAHRLIYLSFQNKNNRLCLVDSNNEKFYQFIHSDEMTHSNEKISFGSVVSNLKNINTNDESQLKHLVNWFTLTENESLNQINEISNEFNRYLFNEDGNKSLEFEVNLIEVAKQIILKCFSFLEPKNKIAKYSKLADSLKN